MTQFIGVAVQGGLVQLVTVKPTQEEAVAATTEVYSGIDGDSTFDPEGDDAHVYEINPDGSTAEVWSHPNE